MRDRHNYLFHITMYSIVVIFLTTAAYITLPTNALLKLNSFHDHGLDMFMITITNLGDGIILIPFFIWLLFERISWAVGLLMNAAIQGVIVSLCKRVVFHDSLRPLTYLAGSHAHFVPGLDVHRWMSFPSGHTVTIFGLCVFLSLCLRHRLLSVSLALLATVVGLSRAYLLQHFLHDVAAGAAIGGLIALASFWIMENINAPGWMTHRLRLVVSKARQKAKPRLTLNS